MTASKSLPSHPSFEFLQKQAKKLLRQFAAEDPEAISRVRAQLKAPNLPLSLRDVQLVIAREYGFARWQELRSAVLEQDASGLDGAVSEAEQAIHDNSVERLSELIGEHPGLLDWRGDSGESLLGFATGSFGDSGDPFREQMFTRIECADFLLRAGAVVEPAIWQGAIQARAKGVLQLLARQNVLPRNLETLAALGDSLGIEGYFPDADAASITKAFLTACRFHQNKAAAALLDRSIQLDPALGEQLERWRGPSAFIELMGEHRWYGSPWLTIVMNELQAAIDKNDLRTFARLLKKEPDLGRESSLHLLVELVEKAARKDRGPFLARLLEFAPGIREKRPPSSAVVFALEYGNAHLLALLTPIWPLPDDLPHAAGAGHLARVREWFDEEGRPQLGSLGRHYPSNSSALRNLHWHPVTAQHVLDVALAWACMNRHFEVASFLLERGADINTNWSTHEPASILHEVAIRGNYEAAQFLIDHGIDMTILDYRWSGTARGWARYASGAGEPPLGDEKMAEFLARAERARQT